MELPCPDINNHFSLYHPCIIFKPSPYLFILFARQSQNMDKLVAQYTRPPHQNEFYSEQEQRALTETLPPLTLKFDLPPLDNVSPYKPEYMCWHIYIVDWAYMMSP